MTWESCPLGSLKNIKSRLELLNTHFSTVEGLEVTGGDEQVEGQDSLRYDQLAAHLGHEIAFIVVALELRDDYCPITSDIIRADRSSSTEDALDVIVLHEVIVNRTCHLLQTDEICIGLFDNF